jgi:hypothetical protein
MSYTYAMSDVHYEVDMALLGCNSKMMWSEIFLQITDMVSVKPEKRGVIVCKNFHMIHNELLDVFYSYMQKRRAPLAGVSFMLLTEHLGFVPDDIADSSYVVSVPRPSRERMEEMCVRNLARNEKEVRARVARIMCELEPEHIVNLKEIYAFASMESASEIPKDVFNIVCDNIINLMRGAHSLALPAFRDAVYDILVYNLDVSECVWYVLCYFVRSGQLASARKMTEITRSFAPFLKYRNNNYREIFHLERIFVLIATVAFDIC